MIEFDNGGLSQGLKRLGRSAGERSDPCAWAWLFFVDARTLEAGSVSNGCQTNRDGRARPGPNDPVRNAAESAPTSGVTDPGELSITPPPGS